jgi:hypothetical protein
MRASAVTSSSSVRLVRVFGVAALAALIIASLVLPARWEQLRTGHWALEHFMAYFAAMLILCFGWDRPVVVACILTVAAALLEVLQSLTPNHSPNVLAAASGVAGVFAAALVLKHIVPAITRRLIVQKTDTGTN